MAKLLKHEGLLYFNELTTTDHFYDLDYFVENKIIDKLNEKVKSTLYGEITQPSGDDFYNLSFSRFSHRLENFTLEDNVLYADVIIIESENGYKLEEIIDDMVFRPRIIASFDDKMHASIEEIITFDAIPKATDGFLNCY